MTGREAGGGAGGRVGARGKGPLPGIQGGLEADVAFGGGKGRGAVAVQVGGKQRERVRSEKDVVAVHKAAGAGAEQLADVIAEHVRDNQIGNAVAVHVGHGDIERLLAVEGKGGGSLEMAVSFTQRNGYGV